MEITTGLIMLVTGTAGAVISMILLVKHILSMSRKKEKQIDNIMKSL